MMAGGDHDHSIPTATGTASPKLDPKVLCKDWPQDRVAECEEQVKAMNGEHEKAPSSGEVEESRAVPADSEKEITKKLSTIERGLSKVCSEAQSGKQKGCADSVEEAMGQIEGQVKAKDDPVAAIKTIIRNRKVNEIELKGKKFTSLDDVKKFLKDKYVGESSSVNPKGSAVSISAGVGWGTGSTNAVVPLTNGGGGFGGLTNPECTPDFGCPPGGKGASVSSAGEKPEDTQTVFNELPRLDIDAMYRYYDPSGFLFLAGGAFSWIPGRSRDENVVGPSGHVLRFTPQAGVGKRWDDIELAVLAGLDISYPTSGVDFGPNVGFKQEVMVGLKLPEVRAAIPISRWERGELRLLLSGGVSLYPKVFNQIEVDSIKYEGAGMDEVYGKAGLEVLLW